MPIRIDPTDLSTDLKRRLLDVATDLYIEVQAVTDREVNGVQITVEHRDQPPTIDVRFV